MIASGRRSRAFCVDVRDRWRCTDPLLPLACCVDDAEPVSEARLLVIEKWSRALPISMWPQAIDARDCGACGSAFAFGAGAVRADGWDNSATLQRWRRP